MAALAAQPREAAPKPQPRIPHLPPEILDMIFEFALSNIPPRLAKVQHVIECDKNSVPIREANVRSGLSCKFTSPWFIPPLMHACVRSRYIAMKRWPLCFANQGCGSWDPVEKPKIFFDMGQDTLYLGEGSKVEVLREWVRRFGTRAERAKVRFIAVELKDEGKGMVLDDLEGASLARLLHDEFPGLVEIYFGIENVDKLAKNMDAGRTRPNDYVPPDSAPRVLCAFRRTTSKLGWSVPYRLMPLLRLELGDLYFDEGSDICYYMGGRHIEWAF